MGYPMYTHMSLTAIILIFAIEASNSSYDYNVQMRTKCTLSLYMAEDFTFCQLLSLVTRFVTDERCT